MATATILLDIHGGVPSPTVPPLYAWTTAGRPYLAFDKTTDELVIWSFQVPNDFASGLKIYVGYSFASEISTKVCRVRSEIMAAADGHEIDVDDFHTVEDSGDVTIPGTAGQRDTISYTPSNLDSPAIAAGSYMAIRLGRENAVSGTNADEDMHWWDITLEYTTT